MVRSPAKRKLRRASRTMDRGSELAAILRDACLRQGEGKLLRMRAECASSAAGRTSRWLRLADGLEHRGVERFARALAGPDHELERLVVALAGVECGIE